ncbi:DUF6228 family protein [Streptomyces sp. NBC_01310]|nr:DUF6228 family protein [Streptomyces sp. NBC_01310]
MEAGELCCGQPTKRGVAAAVTTWLEAGERMSALATDVRHFLGQGVGA